MHHTASKVLRWYFDCSKHEMSCVMLTVGTWKWNCDVATLGLIHAYLFENNCNECLANTSCNQNHERGMDPSMFSSNSSLNPSSSSFMGPCRQYAGMKPAVSRCALVLLSRKYQHSRNMGLHYGSFYRDVSWVKPCSVQRWSVLGRLLTG